MKFKLHRPKQGVWQVALVLFILSMVSIVIGILSAWAFPLMALSAALLLLGTWLF